MDTLKIGVDTHEEKGGVPLPLDLEEQAVKTKRTCILGLSID
jgi:hypothetical protein